MRTRGLLLKGLVVSLFVAAWLMGCGPAPSTVAPAGATVAPTSNLPAVNTQPSSETAAPLPAQAATRTPTAIPTAPNLPTRLLNTFELIDAAVARGEITIDQAAIYKVYALFGVGSPSLPAPYVSSVPVPGDGTMRLLDVLKDWDRLQPSTRAFITDFITPKEITPTVPLASTSSAATPPPSAPNLTQTPQPTDKPAPTDTPRPPTATARPPTATARPATNTPVPPTATQLRLSSDIPNPWGYNFTCCNTITSPPSTFCQYFSCIANFWNGRGHVEQCKDSMFSQSGGIQGSCSSHGGNWRALLAP